MQLKTFIASYILVKFSAYMTPQNFLPQKISHAYTVNQVTYRCFFNSNTKNDEYWKGEKKTKNQPSNSGNLSIAI